MTENQIGPSYGYKHVNSAHLPVWGDNDSDDGYARSDTVRALISRVSGGDHEGGYDETSHGRSVRGLLKRALRSFVSKL